MSLKVGNKIYCKKDHRVGLVAGNQYTIIDNKVKFIRISLGLPSIDFIWVCVQYENDDMGWYYFREYFLTMKEMRKQKIERVYIIIFILHKRLGNLN